MKLLAPEPAPYGKVSWRDIRRGLIFAAVMGGLAAIYPVSSAGFFTLATLKMFGGGAVTGLIGYVLKQSGTNSAGKFMKKESTSESTDASAEEPLNENDMAKKRKKSGVYYFIESTKTRMWLTDENSWTTDPLLAMRFATNGEADTYATRVLPPRPGGGSSWTITDHIDI